MQSITYFLTSSLTRANEATSGCQTPDAKHDRVLTDIYTCNSYTIHNVTALQHTDNAVSTSHTRARTHTHRRTQPRLWLYHIVTPCMIMLVTPKSVTPHGYATYVYATVTPYSVTPHRYATHGYATCLCHLWSCRLRQIRLRHMVTPRTVTPATPSMVTPHSYATCGYAGYATVTPNSVTPHGYATYGTPSLRHPASLTRHSTTSLTHQVTHTVTHCHSPPSPTVTHTVTPSSLHHVTPCVTPSSLLASLSLPPRHSIASLRRHSTASRLASFLT